MRSQSEWSLPASLLGLGVGIAAGVAAGLLAAPMRGAEMRRSLRSRLFRDDHPALVPQSAAASARPLSATLGEIAQLHSGADVTSFEARS